MIQPDDEKYREILLDPIRTCSRYKPKLGQGEEISCSEFVKLYGSDCFYSWLGLNNPLMYAAHKAAGGITSVYRQIGTGSERLIRQIFMDYLKLNDDDVHWSYTVKNSSGRVQTLSLDGRIEFDSISDIEKREEIKDWVKKEAKRIGIDDSVVSGSKGVVFEIRQGYKSKDSKRQNADINNASNAYAKSYIPCLMVMSSQIDGDLVNRYESAKWLILLGIPGEHNSKSTYSFLKDQIGFDFVSFMERNQKIFQDELHEILNSLLAADDSNENQ